MVVFARDFVGMAILETKGNSVLLVDSQAPLASARALQCFQPVAARVPQISYRPGSMQDVELPSYDRPDRLRDSPRRPGFAAQVDIERGLVCEAANHRPRLPVSRVIIKSVPGPPRSRMKFFRFAIMVCRSRPDDRCFG